MFIVYLSLFELLFLFLFYYTLTSLILISMFMFVSGQADIDNSFFAFNTLAATNTNIPSLIVTLTLSSLLGLPPFMGFFTKLFVLVAANNAINLYLLSPILLILLVLMLFYVNNLSYTFDLPALHSDSLNNQQTLLLPNPHSLWIGYVLLSILLVTFSCFFLDDILIIVRHIAL